jgi:hypothetical protein
VGLVILLLLRQAKVVTAVLAVLEESLMLAVVAVELVR